MAPMTSRQRMLTALTGGIPDRLPVTTHHVMASFLDTYMDGISGQGFFDRFALDAWTWPVFHKADPSQGEYEDPTQQEIGFLEARRVCTDDWRIEWEPLPNREHNPVRYNFVTPGGTLTMTIESNEHTAWVGEHLIKNKSDIELLGKYMPAPKCDIEAVNAVADAFGDRGLVRGHICCFDVFGQPGCWADAACLMRIDDLILASYDDPAWVHELLDILMRRKKIYIESLEGSRYDIHELGGGSGSSTVISPKIFDEFVAPYDSQLIEAAHNVGQRIAYHTCGGMMPILENIADMNPDAMETFTPPDMGADVDLAEAKRRIGDRVCMIGGFDQFHYFTGCTPDETRAEVRRCFEAAGGNGGYMLSPSDHFFEADMACLEAFADEAHRCVYG